MHGVKNITGEDPWNAARCIHGEPVASQVLPDHDLGKSTKPNCRNVVRNENDIDRSFGLPTIRKDIPFKTSTQKSVADYQVSFKFLFLSHFFIFRIMEMNQKQLTCYFHQAIQKLVLKNKILENLETEHKLKLCFPKQVLTIN